MNRTRKFGVEDTVIVCILAKSSSTTYLHSVAPDLFTFCPFCLPPSSCRPLPVLPSCPPPSPSSSSSRPRPPRRDQGPAMTRSKTLSEKGVTGSPRSVSLGVLPRPRLSRLKRQKRFPCFLSLGKGRGKKIGKQRYDEAGPPKQDWKRER